MSAQQLGTRDRQTHAGSDRASALKIAVPWVAVAQASGPSMYLGSRTGLNLGS